MSSNYKSLTVEEKLFDNAALLPEVIKLLNEGHTVTLDSVCDLSWKTDATVPY